MFTPHPRKTRVSSSNVHDPSSYFSAVNWAIISNGRALSVDVIESLLANHSQSLLSATVGTVHGKGIRCEKIRHTTIHKLWNYYALLEKNGNLIIYNINTMQPVVIHRDTPRAVQVAAEQLVRESLPVPAIPLSPRDHGQLYDPRSPPLSPRNPYQPYDSNPQTPRAATPTMQSPRQWSGVVHSPRSVGTMAVTANVLVVVLAVVVGTVSIQIIGRLSILSEVDQKTLDRLDIHTKKVDRLENDVKDIRHQVDHGHNERAVNNNRFEYLEGKVREADVLRERVGMLEETAAINAQNDQYGGVFRKHVNAPRRVRGAGGLFDPDQSSAMVVHNSNSDNTQRVDKNYIIALADYLVTQEEQQAAGMTTQGTKNRGEMNHNVNGKAKNQGGNTKQISKAESIVEKEPWYNGMLNYMILTICMIPAYVIAQGIFGCLLNEYDDYTGRINN